MTHPRNPYAIVVDHVIPTHLPYFYTINGQLCHDEVPYVIEHDFKLGCLPVTKNNKKLSIDRNTEFSTLILVIGYRLVRGRGKR